MYRKLYEAARAVTQAPEETLMGELINLGVLLTEIDLDELDALDAIQGERDYQVKQAGLDSRPDMKPQLEIGEVLTAMRVNLRRADEAWYTGSGNHPKAMDFVRKISALGLQAGEVFGMPRR